MLLPIPPIRHDNFDFRCQDFTRRSTFNVYDTHFTLRPFDTYSNENFIQKHKIKDALTLSSKRIKIKNALKDALNTAEEIHIRDKRKIIYELCEDVLNVVQIFEEKKNNSHPDLLKALNKIYHYVIQQTQCAF